jgi:hypothetical protein
MDEFNETVDLSKKIKNPRANARKFTKKNGQPQKKVEPSRGKSEDIDELFVDESSVDKTKKNLQNINKPTQGGDGSSFFRQIAVFLVLAIIGAVVYFMFFNNRSNVVVNEQEEGSGWYSVKLVDEKIYYGQIDDTSAEPVKIRNVYYDYDQLRQTEVDDGVKKETGSLRLVKRGKETHGPSGDMEVFQAKVLFMEPLRMESKVLKAILEYEK